MLSVHSHDEDDVGALSDNNKKYEAVKEVLSLYNTNDTTMQGWRCFLIFEMWCEKRNQRIEMTLPYDHLESSKIHNERYFYLNVEKMSVAWRLSKMRTPNKASLHTFTSFLSSPERQEKYVNVEPYQVCHHFRKEAGPSGRGSAGRWRERYEIKSLCHSPVDVVYSLQC